MNALFISFSMCLLLLAGSCSNTLSPQNSSPIQKGPWSIDFKTSGGFGGIGKGNIAIDSDGKCTYSQAVDRQTKKGVTGTLYQRQLQPLTEAVARLDPNGWNKPGLNVAAPDAFGYNLELRTGPDKTDVATVKWYDNTADQLPEDLKRLSTLLEQAMQLHPCGGPP
jgi:hypothetical protein